MNGYMGKGERAAYDARLSAALERQRDELGFYPSLRQIAENLGDGSSTTTVYTALKRMIRNGTLSAAATKIYGRSEDGKESGKKTSETRSKRQKAISR